MHAQDPLSRLIDISRSPVSKMNMKVIEDLMRLDKSAMSPLSTGTIAKENVDSLQLPSREGNHEYNSNNYIEMLYRYPVLLEFTNGRRCIFITSYCYF